MKSFQKHDAYQIHFGHSGTIGGVPGENLTPIDIVKFTTAYVRFVAESKPGRKLTVVVGRDARISGVDGQRRAISESCSDAGPT